MRTVVLLFTLTLTGCEGPASVNAATERSSGSARNETTDPRNLPAEATGSNRVVSADRVSATEASLGVGACRVQDGEIVPETRLRAVGTEPFWGARIKGRCVTYSHPDDQAGTRIWTRFSGTAEAGQWRGAHLGKPFVLLTRPQADCSDGMSDRRYPIAISLTIAGEERQGCAERL